MTKTPNDDDYSIMSSTGYWVTLPAKDAYIYAFPVVDNYRVQHAYFVDRDIPEFKANWNQIRNEPRVYTHEDVAIQT